MEIFRPKLCFFRFPGQNLKFCHDFVTPFSTFANNRRSYPTNSTPPNRLQPRIWTAGEEFSGLWPIIFSNIVTIFFFYRILDLVTIYTPKEAHSRTFVTGGHFSRDKRGTQTKTILGAASLYNNIYEYEKNGGRKLPSTGSPRWQKQYRTSEKHSKIRVFGSEHKH